MPKKKNPSDRAKTLIDAFEVQCEINGEMDNRRNVAATREKLDNYVCDLERRVYRLARQRRKMVRERIANMPSNYDGS